MKSLKTFEAETMAEVTAAAADAQLLTAIQRGILEKRSGEAVGWPS